MKKVKIKWKNYHNTIYVIKKYISDQCHTFYYTAPWFLYKKEMEIKEEKIMRQERKALWEQMMIYIYAPEDQ